MAYLQILLRSKMGNVECDCTPDSHRTDPDACVSERDAAATDVWKTRPIKYERYINEATKRIPQVDGTNSKGCPHARKGDCPCPRDPRCNSDW